MLLVIPKKNEDLTFSISLGPKKLYADTSTLKYNKNVQNLNKH